MRGAIGRLRRSGGAVPPLLALVLLFRLLVPAGYMIVPGPNGAPGLAPCSAAAPKAPAHHGGHHGHGEDRKGPASAERPCPLAALGAPPLPPAPAVLPAPAQPAESAPAALAAGESRRPALVAPPPPATGPPLPV